LKCDLEESGLDEEYEISDFDVVSLYPAVNFKAFYPIGWLKFVKYIKSTI